jgi:putative spermidine/putrescine transport system substrate-binding protein
VEAGSQSPIFEITAKLYFGGNEVLTHKEGIDAVIAKIAELKSNVKLWWQDEGTMQTALVNDEILGGTYMHDTAIVMARSGTPVRSIFPREGGVEGTNFWCQPSASPCIAEGESFIDFCCTPEAQELIARHVGSAPVLDRSRLNLTNAEFAAVSSAGPQILMATESRFRFTDYMERRFIEMVMR